MRLRAGILGGICVGLLGCTTWPDYATLAAEGEANKVPLLIYSVTPSASQDPWRMQIGLMDLQDKDIASVKLFLNSCDAKGSTYPAGYLLLSGPMSSRKMYSIDAPWGSISADYYSHFAGRGWMITKIEIDNADGSQSEYQGEAIQGLVDKRLSNHCPVDTFR